MCNYSELEVCYEEAEFVVADAVVTNLLCNYVYGQLHYENFGIVGRCYVFYYTKPHPTNAFVAFVCYAFDINHCFDELSVVTETFVDLFCAEGG